MTEAAFLAFQMGAGGQKAFGEYLQAIGLSNTPTPANSESQPISPRDLAILKKLSKEKKRK